MTFFAVIVAAGSGQRAGPGGAKQWRSLGGKPVVRWSLEALLAAGAREVVVVIPAGDEATAAQAFAGLRRWRAIPGGAARHDSVRAGIAACGAGPDEVILIHDAARPFLSPALVQAAAAAALEADGALPALPVADTLKRADAPMEGSSTTARDGLWQAQTPQAFRRRTLERAYAVWPTDEIPTDDASVVERAGGRVVLTPGDPRLMKLTYPEDFEMAEALAGGMRVTRIGMGYDAHRFGPGQSVWLCGVEIPHDHGLVGHSDADAGLHALTDAILGAIGEGDIGDHFPPTDPKWKGAPSSIFLEHAADLVARKGGRIVNVDLTLICERPKIKPHREALRARVAELLRLPEERVSVKATTTEGMGFTGREEGVAAQAIAAVETPA
ncbi:MAG TPA: bifunctional 2-C-methyl-D-erythritol 4-phosphate cytidylyltransferase/2-C-methyl-D-erythritol 2,4-cyclodiphosphate synthase [Caulobacteraceae bacterium]|jgi:2-C-methyl-D-erythritol 4-phosphate cytidylyltransferase/2-C-methyl-D-erythritol 2,4-cyclodiphosphate synthase|nr:bifunctional 2-C-methyl-D-erythritol 4-phosphate cytidylyltransferase/2-C-methyl-D-erythritol 2,4-cyclodiphosphate synthase [Caulobacteraceae bacterium]